MRRLAGKVDFDPARRAVDRSFHHADMAERQAGQVMERKGIIRLYLPKTRVGEDGGGARAGFFRRLVQKDDATCRGPLPGKAERQRRQNGGVAVMAAKMAFAISAGAVFGVTLFLNGQGIEFRTDEDRRAAFTAVIDRSHAMAGHVLPAMLRWHFGLALDSADETAKDTFDPHEFFYAWARGEDMIVDLLAPDWNFWAAAIQPLDAVREAVGLLAPE